MNVPILLLTALTTLAISSPPPSPPSSISPPHDILSPNSPKPLRVALHAEGLHYTIGLNVGGIMFPRFILDTASSDFVLRTDIPPYRPTTFASSDHKSPVAFPHSAEHNLYVDERVITYTSLSAAFAPVAVNIVMDPSDTRTSSSNSRVQNNVSFANSSIILSNKIVLSIDDWTKLTTGWLNSSGVIGIGFPTYYDTFLKSTNTTSSTSSPVLRNNTWSGLLLTAVSPNYLAFSLDFAGDSVSNNVPTMWLGGVPKTYRNKLIWTEYNPTRPPVLVGTYNGMTHNKTETIAANLVPAFQHSDGYYRFTAYDVDLCNVSLTSNISSSWPVLLDSGAACLMLPDTLYDSFFAWLGDSVELFGKDVWFVKVKYDLLPTLSFALKQNVRGVQNKRLYLPLASLMYQRNKWMPPEICVTRSSQNLNTQLSDLTFSQTSKIVFGTMAMKNFFIGVDMSQGRIALGNTKDATKATELSHAAGLSTCSRKVDCEGQQTYYAPSNKCLQPNCNAFLFRAFNARTSTCDWDSGIIAGFVLAIISLVMIELNSGIGHRLFVDMLSAPVQPTHDNENSSDDGDDDNAGEMPEMMMGEVGSF